MKAIFFFPLIVAISLSGYSQRLANSIEGTITDAKNNEPIAFANVILLEGKEQIIGTTTDFDGKYTLKPVKAGEYNLQVSYIGYQTKRIEGVKVNTDNITLLNVSIEQGIQISMGCGFGWNPPLFEIDNTTTERTYSRQQIQYMPF